MPVPPFYHFIRPALEAVIESPGLSTRDISELAAQRLQLSEADRAETIPSGRPRWLDRGMWSLTYLRQAHLIEKSSLGGHHATQRGREFIGVAPPIIEPVHLRQFPEFEAFASRRTTKKADVGEVVAITDSTPQEQIDQAHATMRLELADLVLERLKKIDPARFERVIVELMLRLGYGGPRPDAGETLGKSGDGGVDGIIRQDRLGLDNIYLQAKRYTESSVGTGEVNSFIGALTTRGASKGVLITTSTFSESAKKVALSAPHLKLSLIDGRELAILMIDHNLGVSIEHVYEVKRLDSDYFEEE